MSNLHRSNKDLLQLLQRCVAEQQIASMDFLAPIRFEVLLYWPCSFHSFRLWMQRVQGRIFGVAPLSGNTVSSPKSPATFCPAHLQSQDFGQLAIDSLEVRMGCQVGKANRLVLLEMMHVTRS